MVAGFSSERWPASNRNPGRHQIGIPGRNASESAFKPTDPFGKLSDDDLVAAQVIKSDARHDLALLRPKAVPSHSITPIKVAPQDNIEVGADVHAVGHPTGETWTYTTGIVSQIRPDYEWRSGPQDVQHRATVIQTQTPIPAIQEDLFFRMMGNSWG